MGLAAEDRLGPYEIVALLGAGGMGEVYRAKDTSLGRDVAVKVLPRHLSPNSEVRARFERSPWRSVHPVNPAVSGLRSLVAAPDGSLAYDYSRSRAELYLVRGLK